jgi:ANTAR domain-containing protein/GAF domain-containing protein
VTGSPIDPITATADQPHDNEHSGEYSTVVNAVDLMVEGLRSLGHDRSVAAVMRLATTAAVAGLSGAVDAAVTVRAGGGFRTVAPTSDLPPMIDALQYEHGGPCVDAVLTTESVLHANDLRSEHRWPSLTAAALAGTPVLGMLSYRLFVGHHDETIGSLNLYATKPHAFDPETVTAGERLAAYTAVVLAYAAEHAKALHLERALHSSRDIGAAIGILMTRHLITGEQAFELLRTASQHTHRKLRDLATDVIHTGDLPGVPT